MATAAQLRQQRRASESFAGSIDLEIQPERNPKPERFQGEGRFPNIFPPSSDSFQAFGFSGIRISEFRSTHVPRLLCPGNAFARKKTFARSHVRTTDAGFSQSTHPQRQ